MDASSDVQNRNVPTLPPAPLPADLAKLRDRFLSEFPDAAVSARLLAYVPSALRHLLALRLELNRSEALPVAYREVALAAWRNLPVSGDAVDQMVARYARAIRDSSSHATATLRQELRRYFTEAQIVELALMLAMSFAFETFEAALAGP